MAVSILRGLLSLLMKLYFGECIEGADGSFILRISFAKY